MRAAFYISDGTAITSEVFGHALLSLFPVKFEHDTISFVETKEKALEACKRINKAASEQVFRLWFFIPLLIQISEKLSTVVMVLFITFLNTLWPHLKKP